MTGNLVKIANGYGALFNNANQIRLDVYNETTGFDDMGVDCRRIILKSSKHYADVIGALCIEDRANGALKQYKIFGEHNKPSGTYTGNGSATSRTIDTGGTGKIIMVCKDGAFCLISPYGAIAISTSNKISNIYNDSEIKYNNGILTIASTSESVNKSGYTYYYQVL